VTPRTGGGDHRRITKAADDLPAMKVLHATTLTFMVTTPT
jgi:hypothetical protein